MRLRISRVGLLCLVTLRGCFCVLPLSSDPFSPSGQLPTTGDNGLPTNGVGGFPTSGSNGNPVTEVVGIPALGGDGIGVFFQGLARGRSGLRSVVSSPTPPSPSTTSSPTASPTSTPTTPTSNPTSPSTTTSPTASSGPSSPTCSARQTLLVGVCVECRERIDGCTECSTNDDNTVRCTLCIPGLAPVEDGKSCISGSTCAEFISQCATCEPNNNQVVCKECEAGLFPDEPSRGRCLSSCELAARCRHCFLDVASNPCNTCVTNLGEAGGIGCFYCDGGARCYQCPGDGGNCQTCITVSASEIESSRPTCDQCFSVVAECDICFDAPPVSGSPICLLCSSGLESGATPASCT